MRLVWHGLILEREVRRELTVGLVVVGRCATLRGFEDQPQPGLPILSVNSVVTKRMIVSANVRWESCPG